jgi:hypothetical protein
MKENLYPFELPFPEKPLPKLRSDGTVYLDVKFRDKWDGVLVVNADRRCVGVRLGGQVSQEFLPFRPEEIQDFRPACAWNRILAEIPSILVYAFPYVCLAVLPLLLGAVSYLGSAALVATILVGLAAQTVTIRHMKAYCLTAGPMVLLILCLQAVALFGLIGKFFNH